MTSLKQWLNTRMIRGFIPAAVAMFACSPMGAAMALAAEPDGRALVSRSSTLSLGGLTSDGWPVHILLSRSGTRIERAVGAIDLKCSKGGGVTFRDRWTRVPVRRGVFRDTFRDRWIEDGDAYEVNDLFAGRVNRARTVIKGSWRNTMVVRSPDGSVDTCDSGLLRFTATR